MTRSRRRSRSSRTRRGSEFAAPPIGCSGRWPIGSAALATSPSSARWRPRSDCGGGPWNFLPRRGACPVVVADVDAEAHLRPAVTPADGQPQQPEHVPEPARLVLTLDAGRNTDRERPRGACQRHRVADARLPGDGRNVDEHAVLDGLGARVSVGMPVGRVRRPAAALRHPRRPGCHPRSRRAPGRCWGPPLAPWCPEVRKGAAVRVRLRCSGDTWGDKDTSPSQK